MGDYWNGEQYGDLAHMSPQTLERVGGQAWDVFLLVRDDNNTDSSSAASDTSYDELTTTVVQARLLQKLREERNENEDDKSQIFLHPLLCEFLVQASILLCRDDAIRTPSHWDNIVWLHNCEIAPYGSSLYFWEDVGCNDDLILPDNNSERNEQRRINWKIQKISRINNLPPGTLIVLKPVYPHALPAWALDKGEARQSFWRHALAGRVLVKGSVFVLAGDNSNSRQDLVLVVHDFLAGELKDPTARDGLIATVAYKVGSVLDTVGVQIVSAGSRDHGESLFGDYDYYTEDDMFSPMSRSQEEWELDCPGYARVIDSLLSLTLKTVSPVSPTGILVTGCSGVGKTRLVSCAVGRMQKEGHFIHWLSVHDLLLRATWASEEDLLRELMPPTVKRKVVLVLDDLDSIGDRDGESSHQDMERRLVRNSIVQVIDHLVSSRRGIAVGIGECSSRLPSELVKFGRLEKEISMTPPSQQQRESILSELLQQAHISTKKCDIWAPLLASGTPGCVAADLRRLCTDALTQAMTASSSDNVMMSPSAPVSLSWENLRDAAQKCIPSQLAALDVTKPKIFYDNNNMSKEFWPRIHAESWKNFAGYEVTKKRIYRSVVVPWRRSLVEGDSDLTKDSSIAPPTGVLFYGKSGCGKTVAASCLGASLALPMINVRAADVLDRWLGGSEAAIRSLFVRARAAAPCILFFDEIDAIASNRSEDGETADVMSRLLSTLLNEMDGVSSGPQARVLVVACTNRLQSLDAALLRPGRLEEHIEMAKPSAEDAELILLRGFGRAKLDDRVNVHSLACMLVEVEASGAEIEGLCREAVLRWIREANVESPVSQQHVEEAMVALHLKPVEPTS